MQYEIVFIGGGSAMEIKNSVFICHCSQFTLSFDKINCTSG